MNNQPFSELLKNRKFVLLWISQMLSQFSIQIMNFYVLTKVFSLTKSTIAVSMIWLAGSIPALLFGPFSGAIVDSFSRRKMMIITNSLQAITIAMCLFTGNRIFPLYVIVFTYWLLDQFYYPAQQASTPYLLEKKQLTAANSLFLLTQQGSILVGFGLGGLLLTTVGSKFTILLTTVGLIIAAVSVYFLPKDQPKQTLFEKDFTDFWKEFQAGYLFVKENHSILLPIIMIISTQIFITILTTTLPSYSFEILGLDLRHVSTLLIVPGALGALAVSYFLPRLGKKLRKKVIIQTGLIVGGVSLCLMGILGWIPIAKTLFAGIIAVGLGAAIMAIVVPSQSLLQEKTPLWLQGRVYGQMGFMLILATTIPLLISATMAEVFGVGPFMGIIGIAMLLGALFIYYKGDHVLANGFRI